MYFTLLCKSLNYEPLIVLAKYVLPIVNCFDKFDQVHIDCCNHTP